MEFKSFIKNLELKLAKPLPGHELYKNLIKADRVGLNNEPNNQTKNSAVLLLLYPSNGDIFFPLILRPPYNGKHGSQMAFPGGKIENSDENLSRTALRETQEEIGIKALDVTIIGELTEVFIAVSNYLVKPYVGYINYKPDFYPDEKEVADIYNLALNDVLSRKNQGLQNVLINNKPVEVHGFMVENQWVWGATALIINEFVDVVN